MLTRLPLAELLEELAAPHPAPGSGSSLALALAAAAASVQATARLSAPDWSDATGAAAQAGALRERAAALVQEDADAYGRFVGSRTALADLPPERRDRELGALHDLAAAPPLALCRLAVDVAELARWVAESGDPAHAVDAVVAADLAAAVARGAQRLVATNLTALPGDPRLAEAERCAAAAGAAAAPAG